MNEKEKKRERMNGRKENGLKGEKKRKLTKMTKHKIKQKEHGIN